MDPTTLPVPKFVLGQAVAVSLDTYRYIRRKVLRHELRQTRKVVEGLKRKGYLGGKPGGRLDQHNKARIRLKLSMLGQAQRIEVAGMAPFSLHTSEVVSEAYLVTGQSHSGVLWQYHLLFRRTDENGQALVYIPDIPLVMENQMVPFVFG